MFFRYSQTSTAFTPDLKPDKHTKRLITRYVFLSGILIRFKVKNFVKGGWERGDNESMFNMAISPSGSEFQTSTRQAPSLVKIPTPGVRFSYPTWTLVINWYNFY